MLDRLAQAGITDTELAQLAADRDMEALARRFAHLADADVREWLEELRAAGHFNPPAVEAVEDEQDSGPDPTEPEIAPKDDTETPQKTPSKRAKPED